MELHDAAEVATGMLTFRTISPGMAPQGARIRADFAEQRAATRSIEYVDAGGIESPGWLPAGTVPGVWKRRETSSPLLAPFSLREALRTFSGPVRFTLATCNLDVLVRTNRAGNVETLNRLSQASGRREYVIEWQGTGPLVPGSEPSSGVRIAWEAGAELVSLFGEKATLEALLTVAEST